jgi:AcrR family transcriptional regulator
MAGEDGRQRGAVDMAGRTAKTGTQQPKLTVDSVLERALALADAEGLDAVTIRRLARDLGVTPMALYWHVSNKDDLLDGMAARLLEQADIAVDASASWLDQLRQVLASLLAALRAHPAAAMLLSTRTVSSEGGLAVTEAILDILRRGGFSPAEATQVARHALSTLANMAGAEPGVVLREEAGTQAASRQRARQALAALPAERYPRLVEAAVPLSEGVEPETYFAFGLDLLLAGIETMAAR